jgi:hypothetical protein
LSPTDGTDFEISLDCFNWKSFFPIAWESSSGGGGGRDSTGSGGGGGGAGSGSDGIGGRPGDPSEIYTSILNLMFGHIPKK